MNEKLKIYAKWRKSKLNELKCHPAGLPTNLRNVQLASFFRLYFCCLLDQDLKVNADRKIGQFFVGFFHISKRRKTSLQLNRTETLKPGKKMLTSFYLRTGVRK